MITINTQGKRVFFMGKKGYLILENGQVFEGDSFGQEKPIDGEVVFNTGMVGYPEGLTDPSYCGQILTLTYPLIGNYGVPASKTSQGMPAFFESDKIQIAGLIVSSYIGNKTHWQSQKTLADWLKEEKIPALSGIDTRTLTQILRTTGVMKGKILFEKPRQKTGFSFYDVNRDNLVAKVSSPRSKTYGSGKLRILVFDCGLKYNQIKILLQSDTTIIRVPFNFDPFADKNRLEFEAVFVSNGPGDPKMAKETIESLKKILKREIPVFGVCLGHQLLALAIGANTYKLKYGHRGQNQPVQETGGKCFVTTQNHGYAVDTKTLPSGWHPWFTNLNDGTNEGIKHEKMPFFSVQFHPESTPGPTDTEWLFSYYLDAVRKWSKET